MKLTLIMVSSLDAIISRDANDNPFTWTSAEDKKHFKNLSTQIGVVMMGKNTFKASGRKTYPGRKAILLTTDASDLELDENVIIKSGDPAKIYQELSQEGYSHVALIGGAQVNLQFLKAGLIDDIYLTIEPKIFGTGLHVFGEERLAIELKLLEVTKMNMNGTLLLHYQVLK